MRKSRRLTCRECGSRDEVIDGLCGCCDHRTYCTICKDYIDEYLGCRHMFYDNDACEFIGVGQGRYIEDRTKKEIKQSFFAVLDKTGLAIPLARTIRAGGMGFDNFHFEGTTFGYYAIWCSLYGEKSTENVSGYESIFCGNKFTDNLTPQEEEAMSWGVCWLLGLEKKTKAANKMTVEWIKEWEKDHKPTNPQ